jgi:hypothetical protein
LGTGEFGDRGGEFLRVLRWPAMLGGEELRGHLGAHHRPFAARNRPVAGQAGSRIEFSDPLGNLDPKRRDVVVVDLERRTQPGDKLVVPAGQIRTLQLPLPLRREGMQAHPEQRLHLLRRHRIASI